MSDWKVLDDPQQDRQPICRIDDTGVRWYSYPARKGLLGVPEGADWHHQVSVDMLATYTYDEADVAELAQAGADILAFARGRWAVAKQHNDERRRLAAEAAEASGRG